jgi:hypothetical protein
MLTSDNYFDIENQIKYMSVSQFKAFEKCEAAALAEVMGDIERERTTALLVGSFVDAYFEGTLDVFKEKNPQLFKRNGELKSEYIQAETIIKRIERDPLFMFFLNGEKQVIMTGSIEGIPVKVKIDSYHPDKMIVDLKVMKDFKPIYVEEKGRLSWIEAWEYDLQGAVYQEIVRQNTGKKLPFFIAGATKEKEPDIDIIEIPQPYLDVELERFKENIIRYDGIKKGFFQPRRCEKCDYCKQTKVLTAPRSMEVLKFE